MVRECCATCKHMEKYDMMDVGIINGNEAVGQCLWMGEDIHDSWDETCFDWEEEEE